MNEVIPCVHGRNFCLECHSTSAERCLQTKLDAALAREAALREELARLKVAAANVIVEGDALQQRLTVAERRAGDSFEIAAKWIDKRCDDYVNEHGSRDPETGTVEFPGNGEEYVGELTEIAEGLRALKPAEEGEGS